MCGFDVTVVVVVVLVVVVAVVESFWVKQVVIVDLVVSVDVV